MSSSFRPLHLAVTLAALASAVSLALPALAGPPEVARESFTSQRYDRRLWEVAGTTPGGQVNFEGEALHVVIPPGEDNRPPTVFKGLFHLEGDFLIRTDFQLDSWPKPQSGWVNLAIKIESNDMQAAVIRANHAKNGSAYVAFYGSQSAGTSARLWKEHPTVSKAGALWLERKGSRLRFWAQESGGSPQELGEVEFGTATVDAVALRVTVPELGHEVGVRLDDIVVEADRIVPTSFPGGLPWWIWASLALTAAVAVTVMGGRQIRKRSK